MREALNGAARKGRSKQRKVERLKRDVERKSRIIAEVVEEDLWVTMTAGDVRMVIQDAVKRMGANPQVVTDNGSQFTAKDFKALVRELELDHIRIRMYHPESNGQVERFHRSTREGLEAEEVSNLSEAREAIGRWVRHYNEERLHAARGYLPPAEYYAGDPEIRREERRKKLEEARKRREAINHQPQLDAAA